MEKRIIDACLMLFMKQGIRNTSMDEIAQRLGMSKKTIYQTYTDKPTLVREALLHYLKEEQEQMDSITAQSANPIEEMLRSALHINNKLRTMHPGLIHEMQKYFPQIWTIFESHKQDYVYHKILANIHAGQELGLYRSNLIPSIVAKTFLALIDVLIDPEIFANGQYPPAEVHRHTIEFFMRGITTAQGSALIETYHNLICPKVSE